MGAAIPSLVSNGRCRQFGGAIAGPVIQGTTTENSRDRGTNRRVEGDKLIIPSGTNLEGEEYIDSFLPVETRRGTSAPAASAPDIGNQFVPLDMLDSFREKIINVFGVSLFL